MVATLLFILLAHYWYITLAVIMLYLIIAAKIRDFLD